MWRRRELIRGGVALAAAPAAAGVRATPRNGAGRFEPAEFATVGVFGVDWLLDARFEPLLDQIAASPGSVRGVRAFGVLSLGRDRTEPTVTGDVWNDPADPMRFDRSLDALDALVSRGLSPFLPLTFFPRAVSPEPIVPPPEFSRWEALVHGFLRAAAHRFGAAEVGRWWFEVWNEPNMPPFWRGGFDRYLDLYRATARAAASSGVAIRLGGPAVAYLPGGDAPALIERFLRMLANEPALACRFVSFHRKGVWTEEEGAPALDRLVEAAEATAEAVLRLVPGRASGLAIVNDEADMRVGFDRPYPPRMSAQSPSWLTAVAIAHDRLSARFAARGLRFLAFSDNANQQLAQAAFDGRRTLMTPLHEPDDLIKLPVFGFYELLRLMHRRRGRIDGGVLPPGVSHLLTYGERGIAALLTRYGEGPPLAFDYAVHDIPWPRINAVTFCIDARHTAPLAAAPDEVAMRRAQELGTLAPLRSGVAAEGGVWRERLVLGAYATVLVWLTPYRPELVPAPAGLLGRRGRGRVILRWTPSPDPALFSYRVRRDGLTVAPVPLRSALWTDAAPTIGPARYAVSALSASGQESAAAELSI